MRTTIDTVAVKKRMLSACIAKQQSLINNFRKRIELLVTEGLHTSKHFDSNDTSNTSTQVDKVSALREALHFAEDEMMQLKFLQLFPEEASTKVEPGAVVVTNASTFFVSASIEQFKVVGETYFGLSMHSPLYIAMKGKTAGESFSYAKQEYRIQDIF